MRINDDQFLEYYKRELTYLRRMGAIFAERYPKIAARLELGIDQCPDPHIERLIEAFAFLTARIQYNLESEFPQISTALLSILYPHFLNPIPSMAIARFEVDPAQSILTTGHLIPKHTPLFAQTEQGHICRFRTCYPLVLWPLEVTYAGFESTDHFDFLDIHPEVALVLRIRIETQQESLQELEFKYLRFFLNGDRMLVYSLYELLFVHVLYVAILPDDRKEPIFLPQESIRPVGFEPDEEVLPYPSNAHSAYRLLQEYFTFPEKFLFFDINHLENHSSHRYFDILIMLDQSPSSRLTIDKNTFLLGCTPIINLFKKTTEPIRIDGRQHEYLLIPDKRREDTTEIHSILQVSASSIEEDRSKRFEPFFSFNHQMSKKDHKAYWIARRQRSSRKDLPGTEIFLSFVDLDFNPKVPPTTTVFAHTLCTNRGLAEELPIGAILQIEESAPLSRIFILNKPTPQIDPPLNGETLWRLISHLSLNQLSLADGEESLKAFKELLSLYGFSDRIDIEQQISGIREMSCKRIIRRIGKDAWRGFVKGLEITLVFDERLYVGSSAFLLASVINRFLPLYVSINSFIQLVIRVVGTIISPFCF